MTEHIIRYTLRQNDKPSFTKFNKPTNNKGREIQDQL